MISRMQLLRGGFDEGLETIRPPWAIAEKQFIQSCTRCVQCITTCPTKILERGRGGFPVVTLHKGECEVCGDCVTACETKSLLKTTESSTPWNIKVTISNKCIAFQGVVCRSCGEFCDEQAIRFRPAIGGVSKPETDYELCTGCGACVAVCPSEAITITAKAINEQILEERA